MPDKQHFVIKTQERPLRIIIRFFDLTPSEADSMLPMLKQVYDTAISAVGKNAEAVEKFLRSIEGNIGTGRNARERLDMVHRYLDLVTQRNNIELKLGDMKSDAVKRLEEIDRLEQEALETGNWTPFLVASKKKEREMAPPAMAESPVVGESGIHPIADPPP